jgi:flavin reductase (DIM6/NTAB) family NADH-FMN oxidoreductase RutF
VPVSADQYRQIGRACAGAVSVITVLDQASSAVVALTVSSLVTLSFDPPLVMFAIQKNASSFPAIIASKTFGVSVLGHAQVDVAQRFAARDPHKTVGVHFDRGQALNVPLIPASLAGIECLTQQIVTSGDHSIVVGQVESAVTQDGQPLLYFARQYGSFRPL